MAQGPAYCFSLALACLLGIASVASAQNAEGSGKRAAALHWVRLPGSEDCSGGDALSRAVEAKLRREVFPAPRNASVLIEGHVERVAGGYRAALQMRSSDGRLLGSRELSSQAGDCDELSETIAVVLAVMIDPDTASLAKAPPPPPSEPQPGTKHTQRVVGFARVALGLLRIERAGDEVREPALWGGGLAYERGLGRWGGLRIEAVGFATDVSQVWFRSDPVTAGTARVVLAYAGLGYCPLWLTTGRLRSAACASSEVGGIRARNAAQEDREQGAGPTQWWSASLQARFALRVVGPLELHIGGGGSYVIVGGKFGGGDPAPIDVNKFHGNLDLGLGVRF
jgi:hypothetical protein